MINRTTHTTSTKPVLAALALAATTGLSTATTIDLRAGEADDGTINGAIFSVDTSHPAGTGNFFLEPNAVFSTIQNKGQEEGYNTSLSNVMDVKRRPHDNHEVLVSDLNVVVIGGVEYVGFLLDINEASGPNDNLLTLDDVQILTSPIKVDEPDLASLISNSDTTLRYSMDFGGDDPDTWVLLDYDRNGGGSGEADLGLFVPSSLFGGVSMAEYVYLYSRFGGDDASSVTTLDTSASEADGGFEEWTLGSGENIPEPSVTLLGGLSALLLFGRRTRK